MTKVATLKELCAIPPLELRTLPSEKFEELLHTLQTEYPDNAVAKKRVQLMLDIKKSLTKSAKDKEKEKEPVVNSRKPRVSKTPASTAKGKAGEAGKTSTGTTKPPKPTTKPAPPKPATKPSKGEKLPESLDTERVHFDRIKVGSHAELSQFLFEHPYMIYLFLVEGEEHNEQATRFNVTYASSELLMIVDKSNVLESFMIVQGEKVIADLIKNSRYIEEGTPAKEAFDLAFYKASPITE